MVEYSRATSRGDWSGEWDPSAATQLLLRMDSFVGNSNPLPIQDSSGKGRSVSVHNYVGTSATPILSQWGTGLRLNYNSGVSEQSYIRVYNEGNLFPSSGSFMVGAWFNLTTLQAWNPVLSTRSTAGSAPLFHLAINRVNNIPKVNYRFYSGSGTQLINTNLNMPLVLNQWFWIGAVMDLTLGTYSVHCVSLETGARESTSGTVSGLNTTCTAHLDVAYGPVSDPDWSSCLVDEVVMVAPFTGDVGQWALRSRLANGALLGVRADVSTSLGRLSPQPTANLPVVVQTRAMPGHWGTDTPQITAYGQDVSVRYRLSNNLTAWSSWNSASAIAGSPSAAWIQYEVTLTTPTSYVDDIVLSTTPPAIPPLPNTRPVEPFSLDSLLVMSSQGGVLFQDTLLACTTFDTASAESTLSFTLSLADPKASVIEEEMPVIFKGRHYVVRGILTTHSSDTSQVEVYCERNWYNLLYAGQIDPQPWMGNAASVMTEVLSGSGWHLGQVDPSASLSWENESSTVLGVLKQVAKVYGGDLVFDDQNKFVHLLKQGGRDRGTYFTYEKGIKQVRRQTDTTNLVTRLYGRNAEGVTIAPANNGQDYIEDFSWTSEIRSSVYDFRSGMTPQAMLKVLQAFLADRSQPTLTYEYHVSGLVDRIEEVDRFEVLDIIFIMDSDFPQSVKSRVVQLEIDYVDLRNSKITLANQLRSLASSESATSPGQLTTGQTIDTRDINPFNLLLNSRGDNGMAHWAGNNVQVVEGGSTGLYSFAFGPLGGMLEQTVVSDNRSNFMFSAAVDAPSSAQLKVEVTFQYIDGTSETEILEV